MQMVFQSCPWSTKPAVRLGGLNARMKRLTMMPPRCCIGAFFDWSYQKGTRCGIAPGSAECESLNHCGRSVILSRYRLNRLPLL